MVNFQFLQSQLFRDCSTGRAWRLTLQHFRRAICFDLKLSPIEIFSDIDLKKNYKYHEEIETRPQRSEVSRLVNYDCALSVEVKR